MSFKHPSVGEVINNSSNNRDMVKYFCKDYLNLAKTAFHREHKRAATIEDSEELFQIFSAQWRYHYIEAPKREKQCIKISSPLWQFGCSLRISVKNSTREFVRTVNPSFENVFNYHYDAWIMENGYFTQYMKFCKENKDKFPYRRERYIDFSHLAYNGVTDNF